MQQVTPEKFGRLVRAFQIWMTLMLWALTGLSLGLAIYATTVMQDRIDEKATELRRYQQQSYLMPTIPFAPSNLDTEFLGYYSGVCGGAVPKKAMNTYGGWTHGSNCAKIAETLQWLSLAPGSPDRINLCRNFYAYSANTVSRWGHCSYDQNIDGCVFDEMASQLVLGETGECDMAVVDTAFANLMNSPTWNMNARNVMSYRPNSDVWPQFMGVYSPPPPPPPGFQNRWF